MGTTCFFIYPSLQWRNVSPEKLYSFSLLKGPFDVDEEGKVVEEEDDEEEKEEEPVRR